MRTEIISGARLQYSTHCYNKRKQPYVCESSGLCFILILVRLRSLEQFYKGVKGLNMISKV